MRTRTRTHTRTFTHAHSHTHTETDVYTDGIVKLCMVFTGPHSLTVTPCIYTHIHTHTHRCTWYCEAVHGIYRPPPSRHRHTHARAHVERERCTWYCEAVHGIYRPPPCRHCPPPPPTHTHTLTQTKRDVHGIVKLCVVFTGPHPIAIATHRLAHTHKERDVDGFVKLCVVFTGPHPVAIAPPPTHTHTHSHRQRERCTWYCEAVCGIYRPPPCRRCHTQCLHNLPRPPSGKSDRLLEFDACSAVVKKVFEIYCLVYEGVTQLHITDQ